MNVLIMAEYRAPKSGNFIASLLELSLKLRSRGDQVYFMFPKNDPKNYQWLPWLEENGFEVTLFDDDRDRAAIFRELEAYLTRRSIGLIHCHFGFCLNVLALNLHRLKGVRLLVHDHMDYSPDKNIPLQYLKQTLMSVLFRLQGVGVISVMEKKSRGYRLCGRSRVWFVPNGLSLRRYVARSLPRQEQRQLWNVPEGSPLILFLGWDMNRKGVDIAIRAVDILRATHPTAQLGLLGFGENPTQEQRRWILERTGIDPDVPWLRFFPGAEDMFACHRAADVYLSASRKEAFSYGLLEAISQNVPVVVSDIEGTAWAMDYSKSHSYSVEDPAACAAALADAIPRREEDSNREDMVSRYGIDTWCRDILDIYRQMCA